MIASAEDELRRRVEAWIRQLGTGSALPGRSTVGGGSLPEETLPTWLLALEASSPDARAAPAGRPAGCTGGCVMRASRARPFQPLSTNQENKHAI